MAEERIIEKIRKLLSLTKSNYREEAEAALLKAQELMAQHGLTMTEVGSQKDKGEDKQVVDTCISEKHRNTWYEKRLSAIIGENFRCHPYVTLGRGIYFIGLKDDVEIAKEVFLYALATMVHLASEYAKRWRASGLRGIKNDYMKGFLNGLRDKFKKQVESKDYALVLVKDALVVKAVEDKKLKKARVSRIATGESASAWQAGYFDGRNFDEKRKMIR
ncbi:hypothetical protein Psfp_02325 [Pelotomaculum sp. FP]|uniref:DUF2786 domain-containing protein n=1 Tax=Pelotomaculum sp. FP TaxID=261474 RepID=UPI001065377A|nr:DUF2786 domain-containing protein [Pelotomaculum sp. FP]TEB15149.1 hypothetical protein Psfp_02325 [Pelotomaculum sp. FP]